MKFSKMISFALFLAFTIFFYVEAVEKLKQYNIDPTTITVSGISSGGAMAMQYHFAYSSEIAGAGIFAGVPYLCGMQGLASATVCMLTPSLIPVDVLALEAGILDATFFIDSLDNLNGSKAYIFHGALDDVIGVDSGKKVKEMYDHFGADTFGVFDIPAGHGQPTDNYGGACGGVWQDDYFMNDCDYNGVYEMFLHLYGEGYIAKPEESIGTVPLLGDLFEFDQREFFVLTPGTYSMDTIGYAYVPSGCKDGINQCRLHVAFHGCMAFRKEIQDNYVTKSGYAEIAELNNIIMIFPQTEASLIPINPQGCFDWFMYTGPNFPTRVGAQIIGVHRMIERLVEGA